MATIASKLLCIGEENRNGRVSIVYDLDGETQEKYPDFPSCIQSHCSVLLNLLPWWGH